MTLIKAKGIHDHPEFKLGSIVGAGKKDKKTINLSDFVNKDTQVPQVYDFDKGRKPFPSRMWGNNSYGDCEIAMRANCLLRLQRSQTRTTPAILDDDVISLYKQMTGCVSPGDGNDTGLTTLANLSQWKSGWTLEKDWQIGGHQARNYQISAYGMVNIDPQMIRLCTYLFQGTLWGINLPLTCQQQTENNQPWDVVAGAGSASDPGSWGGHAVYSKRFDSGNYYVLTWQREVQMTEAFVKEYVDEIYSVVDSFDTWFSFAHLLDVEGMIKQMQDVGINVQR